MINIEKKYFEGMTFIDLFAGIGGFRLALESLGATCVYSSEIDKYAQQTYAQNFGETPAGDITLIDEKTIPDHDILCGGFPCQPFSISGKKKGFEDSRGTLFFEIARIIKEKTPKVVFLENVKNFVTHDNGHTLEIVKTTLEELGYVFFYKVLKAADYGVPQNRERVYMVCFRKDLDITNFTYPKPFELTKHVEDLLLKDEKLVEDLYVIRPDTYITKDDNVYKNKMIRLGYVNKGSQSERIYSVKGTAATLCANGGGIFSKTSGYLVNGKPRKLHPRECARLMGFPDTFQINKSSNQAKKQFGNSVVVDVIQYIAIEIGKCLENKNKEVKNYDKSRL